MSVINLTKVAEPATPAANTSVIYVDTADRRLKQKDDNGVVSMLVDPGMQGVNTIYNGGIAIQQRVATGATNIAGVSTTTRAGVVADRWAVTVGNTTTPQWTQVNAGTTTETGLLSKFYGKITQNTNAAKFIFSQVLANEDICHLRGTKVRLSCKIKQFVGSNANYRLGLLYLTASGTADTIPAITSAFNGASTDPTWGTNLTAIAPDASPTGENGTISGNFLTIASTANWVRSSAVYTIPATALNLIIVLFRDTIGAASDVCGVTEFQLTQGPDICDYVAYPLGVELLRCQRYFAKSFQYTTVPATNAGVVNAISGIVGKAAATALASKIYVKFPVTMFKSPTVTGYNPSAANAQMRRIDGTTPADQSATAQLHLGDSGLFFTATGDANGAVGDTIAIHYSAEAEFIT